MREVKLPSGATLKVAPSPFSVSKALYQAMLREMRTVFFPSSDDVREAFKEFFCIGFASVEIEKCLWKCFERCTYNSGSGDLKITEDSFEPVSCRDDYIKVCLEVAQDNVAPFIKSLYAELPLTTRKTSDIPK